jgi:hypothetical protein
MRSVASRDCQGAEGSTFLGSLTVVARLRLRGRSSFQHRLAEFAQGGSLHLPDSFL